MVASKSVMYQQQKSKNNDQKAYQMICGQSSKASHWRRHILRVAKEAPSGEEVVEIFDHGGFVFG